MQALYIIDQSWCVRRWNLQRTIKAKQIDIHIMYEDCREHVSRKTKPKPRRFSKLEGCMYGHPILQSYGICEAFFDSPVCKPWPMFSLACRWRCGSVRMWSLTRRCSCWDSDIYQPRPATSQWMRLWSSRLHEPWSETLPDYSSVQKMINKLRWLTHITLRNL